MRKHSCEDPIRGNNSSTVPNPSSQSEADATYAPSFSIESTVRKRTGQFRGILARLAGSPLRRSRRFWLGLAALYAFTWVGGWVSHQRNLSEHTRLLHEQARDHRVELAAFSKRHGIPVPLERSTFDEGYRPKVNWCFPVLPGLLIADSEYAIGPLHGRGGLSIIVFYGFGSLQFGPFGGWIS